MASKSSRYQLRSSQRCGNAESQDTFDTPKMDEFGNPYNAQLSQSDALQYDSQLENFFSESFGSRFLNMSYLNESEIRNNLGGIVKDEIDPPLSRVNFVPSQELNNPRHPEEINQFHLNDGYEQPQYMDNHEDPGRFAYSQTMNKPQQGHIFTVSLMPQAKSANRDYLTQSGLLFVKFMSGIPFNFSLVNGPDQTCMAMPNDMYIRVSLRFENPVSDDKERVARCHVHSDRDPNGLHKSFPFTLNHRDAVYDDTKLWATIPACSVVVIQFYCYSSCAGGIDRKPIYLLFELLDQDGTMAQSVVMPVKVSANPSRDAPKEEERRKKEEAKFGRARAKSEAGSDAGEEKRGRKRKTGEGQEMGRDIKRMESASPMQSLYTPSPGWNPIMSAPRATPSARRNSKLDIRSTSSDGMLTESNGFSLKSGSDDDEEKIYQIKIQGKKKYELVMDYVKTLEQNERYKSRNEEDNPYENLTQITGEISISTWLSQYHLNEEKYVEAFHQMGITILDDVDPHYTPSLFHCTIGIPKVNAARLNKVFINWLNVTARQRFD